MQISCNWLLEIAKKVDNSYSLLGASQEHQRQQRAPSFEASGLFLLVVLVKEESTMA